MFEILFSYISNDHLFTIHLSLVILLMTISLPYTLEVYNRSLFTAIYFSSSLTSLKQTVQEGQMSLASQRELIHTVD